MNVIRSRIAAAMMLCCIVLTVGALGFVIIEDYTLIDGFYMSAITVSTVGFSEVQPLSTAGRIFTTGLILCSFLTLAYAGHTIGQSLLENVWSGQTERKKMKKRIDSMKSHYIVCGYGRVGAAAVHRFEKLSSQFVVIESDENQLAILKERGYPYITGDATHEEVLDEAGIKNAKGLLSLLNNDPDNLFVVLTAREMNPTLNILSRANESSSSHKIIRAGADDVVSPYDSAGKQIASEILRSTGQLDSQNDIKCIGSDGLTPKWISIEKGSGMVNQTIDELSREMQRPILGLRRKDEDCLVPDKETVLLVEDQILVLDETDDDSCSLHADHQSAHELVIVDDNPVIVKLYSRLFQKAGYVPHIATNGKEGLDAILRKKPHAAVIDYQLPMMSGIEVCQNVRQQMNSQDIKLVLFTTDESIGTRKGALDAGADAVVVKSSDASEIIRTVGDVLRI